MGEVTKYEPRVVAEAHYSDRQLDLIRRTVASDCDQDEVRLFVEVAKSSRLNPFRRQIYALVFNKDKPDRRRLAVFAGIDGLRATAARNGTYLGMRDICDTTFSEEAVDKHINPKGLVQSVATVWKAGPHGDFPVVGVARWEEFVPKAYNRQQDQWFITKPNWKSMSQLMLEKCAEAQALRRGWPEEVGGIYEPAELDRSIAEDAWEAAEKAAETERLEKIGHDGKKVPIVWDNSMPVQYEPVGRLGDMIMAHLRANEPAEIKKWYERNVEGLKQYWGFEPNEYLEIKPHIEKAIEAAEKPEDGDSAKEGASTEDAEESRPAQPDLTDDRPSAKDEPGAYVLWLTGGLQRCRKESTLLKAWDREASLDNGINALPTNLYNEAHTTLKECQAKLSPECDS
jgi:phage recombination protein Bet